MRVQTRYPSIPRRKRSSFGIGKFSAVANALNDALEYYGGNAQTQRNRLFDIISVEHVV